MADNKTYISNVQNIMTNLVNSLDEDKCANFLALTNELLNERLLRFGKNPNFQEMSIREKIYPGMYFYNLINCQELS